MIDFDPMHCTRADAAVSLLAALLLQREHFRRRHVLYCPAQTDFTCIMHGSALSIEHPESIKVMTWSCPCCPTFPALVMPNFWSQDSCGQECNAELVREVAAEYNITSAANEPSAKFSQVFTRAFS